MGNLCSGKSQDSGDYTETLPGVGIIELKFTNELTKAQHNLIFKPEPGGDARKYKWYQLIYRQYSNEKGLIKADLLSRATIPYRSGEEAFNVETEKNKWVLDAHTKAADFITSFGKKEPTQGENKLDDEPSWSANVGWWNNGDLVRGSLKKNVFVNDCESEMFFMGILTKPEEPVDSSKGIYQKYNIKHIVIFRRYWQVINSSPTFTQGNFLCNLSEDDESFLQQKIKEWESYKNKLVNYNKASIEPRQLTK